MSPRFLLLFFVVVCVSTTSAYGITSALQQPDTLAIAAYSFYDVHERSISKCDICHPPAVDIESSALFLTSDLCLDCHDNIKAVSPEERRTGNISAMGNHPVKFSPLDYVSAKLNQNIIRDGWKFFISGPEGTLPLFGETLGSAVVECATCHDPHGAAGDPKLRRIVGQNGELCRVCHLGY